MKPKVLRNRDFRNLWIGQTISQFGDAVYGLLFLFMADKITQKPEIVGLVAASTALPFLIFSPIAGVWADRIDRRKIMLFCDLASALVLLVFSAILLVNPAPPLWAIFVIPFLLSTINAFFSPARGAAIPSLVTSDELLAANSLSTATLNLMHTIGLMLAALILGPLESLNPSGFFSLAAIVNLATFLLSAFFLWCLPKLEPRSETVSHSNPLEDLKEGVRLFSKMPVITTLFVSNFLVNLAISGFMVVYTATNRAWFDGKFITLAGIELAFVIGLVSGSLLVPRFNFARIGWFYSCGLALVGLLVIALGMVRSIPVFMVINFIAGVALPFVNVPFGTYINLAVPSEFRGRLNSAMTMVTAGVQPLGSVASGAGLRLFGISQMYLIMGGACAIAGLAPLSIRAFREERMPSTGA